MSGVRVVLTSQQVCVLQRLADGLTIPGIAAHLRVSPNTVKTHLDHARERIFEGDQSAAVSTQGGLVAWAMRQGLVR